MKVNEFFNSPKITIFVLVLGVAGTIARLVNYSFPGFPAAVQIVSTIVLVASILYIIGLVIFAIRRYLNKSEGQRSYLYTSKRYGVGYDSIEVECFIEEDGSARVQRTVHVQAHSRIEKLDNFLLIKEKSPSGRERIINYLKIKSLSEEIKVSEPQLLVDLDQQRLSAEVSFTPILRENTEVRYQLEEKLPTGLYAVNLNQQEISNRADIHDYFGWNISRPTKKLNLKVYFPPGTQPSYYRNEVVYATASKFPSSRKQDKEEQNLADPKMNISSGNRHVLSVEIEYPMIGLIYILCWKPIPQNIRSARQILEAGNSHL